MAPGTPDPAQFLGIRLSMTFDTCEVIEERWANWMRHDPVVAVETQREHLRRLKALYIDLPTFFSLTRARARETKIIKIHRINSAGSIGCSALLFSHGP